MYFGAVLHRNHKNGYTATERPEPTASSSATNQAELSGLDSLGQFVLCWAYVNAHAHNAR